MKKLKRETLVLHYHVTRRENFAASQRLEGIKTTATAMDNLAPLPSKDALRKKYLVTSLRG
ncbi:YhfG family protein [Xanthomonas translucens]|uniref:YhfG family protein n=1 Tax=Xanthomonas campestris pv. translucens TaxID=343 RepID=UPI00071E6C83|nr:YhfG family protein [Xanthomonas translucens]